MRLNGLIKVIMHRCLEVTLVNIVFTVDLCDFMQLNKVYKHLGYINYE